MKMMRAKKIKGWRMQSIMSTFILILSCLLLGCCVKVKGEKNNGEITENSSERLETSDTIISKTNRYYLYIKDKYPKSFIANLFEPNLLKPNELVYYKEKDIDLDGHKEIIIAIGKKEEDLTMWDVDYFFILRDYFNVIKEIKVDYDRKFRRELYRPNDIKLISLQGKKQNYICLGITDSQYFGGFMLLEMKNDTLKEFYYSRLDKDESGRSKLLDKNHDGQYDGYLKRGHKYKSVYRLDTEYVFENNTFNPSDIHVRIPDYPNDIKGILMQYISLRLLGVVESTEVKERLKELCITNNPEIDEEAWANAYSLYSDKIEYNIKESAHTAIAEVIYNNTNKYQLKFQLRKSDDKWQITKIELL